MPESFNVQVQTKYGVMVCNRHDAYVGASLQLYGEFSEGEAVVFRSLIPPGGVVIEVGSNCGALTIPIAQHVAGDRDLADTGAVFAYEPQRLAFQLLNANVALNQLTNVITRNMAVGASRGTIPVPLLDPRTTNNIGGLDIRGHTTGEPVPIVALDDVHPDLARLDFLKADVEGMELAVLLGARRLITTHRPILYLEADRQYALPPLLGVLETYRYRVWLHRPPLFRADNFNGVPENIFIADGATVVSINLLCIPAEVEVPWAVQSFEHLVPLTEAAA